MIPGCSHGLIPLVALWDPDRAFTVAPLVSTGILDSREALARGTRTAEVLLCTFRQTHHQDNLKMGSAKGLQITVN